MNKHIEKKVEELYKLEERKMGKDIKVGFQFHSTNAITGEKMRKQTVVDIRGDDYVCVDEKGNYTTYYHLDKTIDND